MEFKAARDGFRSIAARYRVQFALCSRITVAALSTLAIGQGLGMRMVLWAVLTAVILTQMSVGRSVKATIDYSLGTIGGALYAGLIAAFVPVPNEIALIGVLTLAIAPLALLAAVSPRFAVAPTTAAIIVLAPTITHASAFVSAYDRVLEVALGGGIALIVSNSVFPARARILAREAAADMLDIIARALPDLFAGFTRDQDLDRIRQLQRGIGAAFDRLDKMESEARHERMAFLDAEADLGPLLRALLRMRHDLIMIGRAASTPFPATLQARLGSLLERIAQAAGQFAGECGKALLAGGPAPLGQELGSAFDAYAAEIIELRKSGELRLLSVEDVERVFALSFALEQWRQDMGELARSVDERAPGSAVRVGIN